MRRSAFRGAALTLALTFPVAAGALPPEPRDWALEASFYMWAASMDVDVEARGVETSVDIDFFDILDDLKWAVMGGVEGRYKRALLLVDTLGMQTLSEVEGGPRRINLALPGGATGELAIGEAEVSTRLTTWAIDVKAGVRALSLALDEAGSPPAAPGDARRLDVDLLAGIRYWNVHVNAGVDVEPASLTVGGVPVMLPGILPDVDLGDVSLPGPFLRGTDRGAEQTTAWVDPIVGLRVRGDVTARWSLFLIGDVGGFGIGSASNFTWQAMLGSQYDFGEHWSVRGGYRALGVERDGPVENQIMHGPQVGVVYRF